MAMTRGGDTVLVKFLCIEQGTAQTPFHSRLWGFQKIHASDMCISFGIVVSLASMYWAYGIAEQDTSRYERRGRAQKGYGFLNVS